MAELRVIYKNLYEQREEVIDSSLTIAEFLEQVEWPIKAAQLNGDYLRIDDFDKTFEDYGCKTFCCLYEAVKCGSAYTNMPHRDLGYEIQFNKYRTYDMYTTETICIEQDSEYDYMVVCGVFKTPDEAINSINVDGSGFYIRGHNYGEHEIQEYRDQFDIFVDVKYANVECDKSADSKFEQFYKRIGTYIDYTVADVLLSAGINIEDCCYIFVDGEKFFCTVMLTPLKEFGVNKNSSVTIINSSFYLIEAERQRALKENKKLTIECRIPTNGVLTKIRQTDVSAIMSIKDFIDTRMCLSFAHVSRINNQEIRDIGDLRFTDFDPFDIVCIDFEAN